MPKIRKKSRKKKDERKIMKNPEKSQHLLKAPEKFRKVNHEIIPYTILLFFDNCHHTCLSEIYAVLLTFNFCLVTLYINTYIRKWPPCGHQLQLQGQVREI